jgi:hypothetical protein
MNKAVQDGIGISGIADQFVPTGHRELTGYKGRAPTISVFKDFEQMVAGIAVEGIEAPVVEDQQIDAGQALHSGGNPAITFGKCQFLDQPWQPGVQHRTVVAARLMAKRASQPTLADPGWPDNRAVLVLCDPIPLDKHVEQATIKTARGAVIDVLGHSVMSQSRMAQTQRQASVIAVGGFMVEQQRQPFGVAQAGRFIIVDKVSKSLRHSGQTKLAQQIEGWMFEHSRSFQW